MSYATTKKRWEREERFDKYRKEAYDLMDEIGSDLLFVVRTGTLNKVQRLHQILVWLRNKPQSKG